MFSLLSPSSDLKVPNKGSGDEVGKKVEENMKTSRKFVFVMQMYFSILGDVYVHAKLIIKIIFY